MRRRPDRPRFSWSQLDGRGWIALAWVLWWAWAYALMVIQARLPQVLGWFRSLASGR